MTSISDMIITNLREVSIKKYEDLFSLLSLCKVIGEYDSFIKSNIDTKLYETLGIEFDKCYNEFQFGNGEYSENIYNDCIKVIEEVIAAL
jgi:hypothetical protein